MSPDDYKHLRYLIAKESRLPQPLQDLMFHTSKRWSRFAERMPTILQQAKQQEKDSKQKK